MKWSIRLGEIAGIKVFVHWTFVILIGWIFLGHLHRGGSLGYAVRGVELILALFACVLLHELGHALTARRYGIQTKDITLLPIGGVARLERMPTQPIQEFWVALAGPAVNVVIAAALFVILRSLVGFVPLSHAVMVEASFLAQLMYANLLLVGFNLLPAFPMDGGRVLRALLATRLDYARATRIAARIGQGMAIVFGFLGLMATLGYRGTLFSPMFLFIALFVFIGAEAEADLVQFTSTLRGLTVREAMITKFRALTTDEPLSVAVAELIAGSQADFPVLEGERVAGMLTRSDLVKTLAERGPNIRVGDAMQRECQVIAADTSLEQCHQALHQAGCSTLPVEEEGRLVGLITLENIGEWVMVNRALRQSVLSVRG
jgi:Zn-dependent protease